MKRVENRNALIQGIAAITIGLVLIGCGSGGSDANCIEQTQQACTISSVGGSDTDTSTVTPVSTGGNLGTGGSVVTGGQAGTANLTSTSTSTATWSYSDSAPECAYSGNVNSSSYQKGLWTIGDWNICITEADSDGGNAHKTGVTGYGYRRSDFTDFMAVPASTEIYVGVMAEKCIHVFPGVSVPSGRTLAGPTMQGPGVAPSATGSVSVSDGKTTAYRASTDAGADYIKFCPFDVSTLRN